MQAVYGFAMPTATRCQENALFRDSVANGKLLPYAERGDAGSFGSERECDDTSACPLNSEAFN
jgi:hypothetical protein